MSRTAIIYLNGLVEPFRVVTEPREDDLIDARKRALLKEWRKRRFALGRLPRLNDLSAALLGQLAPNLVRLAVQPDGDLRYEAYGAALSAAYGQDMKGELASAVPEPTTKAFLSLYCLALKHPVPYATHHKPLPPVKVDDCHRLIVPLDEEQRGRPDHFLVCMVPLFR
jgi:hypothetical protein